MDIRQTWDQQRLGAQMRRRVGVDHVLRRQQPDHLQDLALPLVLKRQVPVIGSGSPGVSKSASRGTMSSRKWY